MTSPLAKSDLLVGFQGHSPIESRLEFATCPGIECVEHVIDHVDAESDSCGTVLDGKPIDRTTLHLLQSSECRAQDGPADPDPQHIGSSQAGLDEIQPGDGRRSRQGVDHPGGYAALEVHRGQKQRLEEFGVRSALIQYRHDGIERSGGRLRAGDHLVRLEEDPLRLRLVEDREVQPDRTMRSESIGPSLAGDPPDGTATPPKSIRHESRIDPTIPGRKDDASLVGGDAPPCSLDRTALPLSTSHQLPDRLMGSAAGGCDLECRLVG